MDILVVDDEESVRLQASLALEGEGHYVETAEDGASALRRLKEENFDLVLLDLMLGDDDGLVVLQSIKREVPHVLVAIFTAHASLSTAIKAMQLGAFDYLEKPFTPDQMRILLLRCQQKLTTDSLVARLSGRIFLSYAREDKEKVEKVYFKLKAAGFNPWMDVQDILPGQLWENSINQAIQESLFFFAFISRSSLNKRGMIQKEIRAALEVWNGLLDSDSYLVPIRLEDCPVAEPLKKFQWVDLFASDGWNKLIAGMNRSVRSHG